MKITREWLEERRACAEQMQIFAKEWPEGGELNRQNLEQAVKLGLKLEWLRGQLSLPQPAKEEYHRVTQEARDACNRVIQDAQDARKECNRVIQAALEEYHRVTQEVLVTLLLSA